MTVDRRTIAQKVVSSMPTSARRGPLEGIRILDLSQVMAGPFCTMLLGDLGADVIKVESPAGDSTRQMAGSDGTESPSFWAVNRNKRGIVVNLKDPRGAAVCRRLAAHSDILVENYRPGTLDRLGLGYDVLRQDNPGLIYASISGYGRTGPFAYRGGFDLVAQAETGLMSITGEPDSAPVKCGISVCDLGAALFITYAVLAAYIHRSRTGEGQHVETSLFEAGIALSVWEATEYFATNETPRPTGSAHRMSAPYQAFRCSDGHITIGAANQRTWERLCQALELESLVNRPEFAIDGDRVRHREALAEMIEAVTVQQPRAYWLRVLDEAGVPCGPINNYAEVFQHPQAIARGMLQELSHPRGGRIRQVGPAVKYSATPAEIRRPAPGLGQHTAEILAEIGYTAREIQALAREGVIKVSPSS